MYTTFHLKSNELDENFLKKLKRMFEKKNISITVEEEMDETEYLLSSPANRKMLLESIKSEEGYEFSGEEFKKLTRDLENGKRPDFSKIRKVKLPK